MKIHPRPPPATLLPAPLKPPPTAFEAQLQAEQLAKTAEQQRTRLRKLFAPRQERQEADDNAAEPEQDGASKHNLDFLA